MAPSGATHSALDFDRSGGVINAEGHYSYLAAFAGAALSGQTTIGRFTVSPRAGLDVAWSPGGQVDVTAARGALEDNDKLKTGAVSGTRFFGEARIEDLLPGSEEVLAITSKVFCDRPIGAGESACGYGGAIELSRDTGQNGATYSATLEGEASATHAALGLKLEYAKPLLGGEVKGNATVSDRGDIAVGSRYNLAF